MARGRWTVEFDLRPRRVVVSAGNLITAHDDCDPIAATPYHKNVAFHLVPVVGAETEAAEAASSRVRAVAAAQANAAA